MAVQWKPMVAMYSNLKHVSILLQWFHASVQEKQQSNLFQHNDGATTFVAKTSAEAS